MSGMKVLIFIVSILIAFILSAFAYFIFTVILAMYAKYTNPYPEHGLMPLGALVYAAFPTIPISIFLLVKIYKLLVMRNE
jgi:uncharacterized BrkB/YihY/UPF0761 family membrane protein